jgi:hypothetical protein
MIEYQTGGPGRADRDLADSTDFIGRRYEWWVKLKIVGSNYLGMYFRVCARSARA